MVISELVQQAGEYWGEADTFVVGSPAPTT